MDAATLLRQLWEGGCELRADGALLRVRAPAGFLNDQLRDAIRLHKAELLALLHGRREGREGVLAPALGPDGRCTNCGGDVWWLSWYNVLNCMNCAPPPGEDRVRRQVSGKEALGFGNICK